MNPYQKYQQQVVSTMTQGDLLLKLFDETTRQIDIGRAAIADNRLQDMGKALKKANEIVMFLRSSLDQRFPVSSDLLKLYDFFSRQLVMANVKKDSKMLDEIEPLIQDLRNTFDQCDKLNRANRTNLAAGDVV